MATGNRPLVEEDKSDDVVDADFEEVDDEKEKKTGS